MGKRVPMPSADLQKAMALKAETGKTWREIAAAFPGRRAETFAGAASKVRRGAYHHTIKDREARNARIMALVRDGLTRTGEIVDALGPGASYFPIANVLHRMGLTEADRIEIAIAARLERIPTASADEIRADLARESDARAAAKRADRKARKAAAP